MVGTPGFMAPEQSIGTKLDGRSDLYALGCCAWWLLTGEQVFRRESFSNVLQRHLNDPIGSLRLALRGWCPPKLEEVVASYLAKEPEKRPANARELAALLRAIEIFVEYAWADENVRAWWAEYKPPIPTTPLSSSNVPLIMAGEAERVVTEET